MLTVWCYECELKYRVSLSSVFSRRKNLYLSEEVLMHLESILRCNNTVVMLINITPVLALLGDVSLFCIVHFSFLAVS